MNTIELQMPIRSFVCVLGVFVLVAQAWADSQIRYIQTNTAALRNRPNILAESVVVLNYRTAVEVMDDRRAWLLVRNVENRSQQGWIQQSALVARQPVQIQDSEQVGFSGRDVSLAGRGFSREYEDFVREADPNLDFSRVDEVEKIDVSPAFLRSFRQSASFRPAQRRN